MKTIGKHKTTIRKPYKIHRKSIGGTLGFPYENYTKIIGKSMKTIGKHTKTIPKPYNINGKSIGGTLGSPYEN